MNRIAKLLLPIFMLAGLDGLSTVRQGDGDAPPQEECPNCGKKFVRVRSNWNFCQASCYKAWLKKQTTHP